MTISSETSRHNYNGTGSQTVFPYTFKIYEDSDLTVIIRDANGVETTQVLGVDYTVSGAGNDSGGNVTMTTAPASTELLVIMRVVSVTQQLDYVENDPFPAASHEAGLDRLTMIVLQFKEELARALKLKTTSILKDLEVSAMASKLLGFDSAGTALALYPLTDLSIPTIDHIGNYNDDLATAVSEIGAANTTLLIHKATAAFTAGVTVPANIKLLIHKGGLINHGAHNITINGPFECGLFQAFSGTGTVTLGPNATTEALPEWWGIDGTDDNVEIEKALNACSTAKIPVRLIQDYIISDTVDIPDNGCLFSTNKAKITCADSMNAGMFQIAGDNIIVDNLELDGNKTNQTSGNAFYNVDATEVDSDNIEVKNCYIHDIYDYGFQVDCSLTKWSIHHNRIEGTGDSAISFQLTAADETADNIKIFRNSIDGCGGGIQVFHASTGLVKKIKIIGNDIVDTDITQIPIEINCQNAEYGVVLGNIISGNGKSGLSLGTCNHLIATNNLISDQASYGMELGTGTNQIISSNEIYNCGVGIYGTGGTMEDFTISDNVISSTTAGTNHDGIRLGGSITNGVIANNVISDAYSHGIALYGISATGDLADVNIVNNTIVFKAARGANQAPIAIQLSHSDGVLISNNKISANEADPNGSSWVGVIVLAGTGAILDQNVTISNNDILGVGAVIDHRAIDLSAGSRHVYILNNTIKNFTNGIHTSDTTDPYVQLKGNIIEGCTTPITTNASHKTEKKATSPNQGTLWYPGDQVWKTAPTASNPPGWVCVSRVKTEFRLAGVATDTTIELDSSAGMTAGNIIGLELDSGAWHWTTVASIVDGDTITITDGLPSGAAIDNDIITNLWKAMASLAA